MGLDDKLLDMRGTRYQGLECCKEADSAFKPISFRPGGVGWPTLVVECGVSESLDGLRWDAKWWLKNSGWSVYIVLLFSISSATQLIQIGE
ncbi:hypothetical protein HOY80DRAFT_529612 [Tuber brumale]|nr:hypothetical protein HOY80DRAFT_529612 [Tuber brumale]